LSFPFPPFHIRRPSFPLLLGSFSENCRIFFCSGAERCWLSHFSPLSPPPLLSSLSLQGMMNYKELSRFFPFFDKRFRVKDTPPPPYYLLTPLHRKGYRASQHPPSLTHKYKFFPFFFLFSTLSSRKASVFRCPPSKQRVFSQDGPVSFFNHN